jgi:hypothetical protein
MAANGQTSRDAPGGPCRNGTIGSWKLMRQTICFVVGIVLAAAAADGADGNRLAYLDESDPFYVSRHFPKLVTPQWIGETGVEAVIILSIDDQLSR